MSFFSSNGIEDREAEKVFQVYEQCFENAKTFAAQEIQTQDLVDAQIEAEIRNDLQISDSETSPEAGGAIDEPKSEDDIEDAEDEDNNIKINLSSTFEEGVNNDDSGGN